MTARRIAVLSDIHGDLVAFRKVIADLETVKPVDEVLLGGDLAQGGAQPAQVIDEILGRGWPSVRGNADELLLRVADGGSADDAIREAEATHGRLPRRMARHAEWSVSELGPARIDYLRQLPLRLERGPFAAGSVVLFHATPWSVEEVVLPDAEVQVAERMVGEARARLAIYGHIHAPYQRRVGDSVLICAGAVSGSNDADPRPAYSIVSLGDSIQVEVRRVEWPVRERLAAYRAAGIPRRFSKDKPGPLPIRSQASVAVTVWP